MCSALGIPKQPRHLRWHNPRRSRSTTSAGAGSCFHPSPCKKKSLIQTIENICKSNYLPWALPGALPPPSPSAPCVSAFSSPAVSRGTHKGLDAGAAWQQLCPLLQRCLDTSAQLPLRPGVPISSLGVDGEGPVVASTPHIAAHLLRGSAVYPWDLGSLPCSFPPSHPAGRGTGVTGTLRPGCFPINCYFLIPLAVRRAASWLRLPGPAAGRPPARS